MFSICKVFTFEAAHQLPHHDGKCANLHGHTYQVELEIQGQGVHPTGKSPPLPYEGMVIDFGRISKLWKAHVFDVCDHRFLNEVLPVPVTTAEHIAHWIMTILTTALHTEDMSLKLSRVRVWETQTSWAEVRS